MKLCRPGKILSCLLTYLTLRMTQPPEISPSLSHNICDWRFHINKIVPPSSDFGSSQCTPCFSWRAKDFLWRRAGGLFSPGAVTAASHTRLNLKRQVNCCSLHINRAIYLAPSLWLFLLSSSSSVSPSLSFLSLVFFLLPPRPAENVWGIDTGSQGVVTAALMNQAYSVC